MKKNYYKFCNLMAQACGAFAVAALILSILIIVELVFERYFFQRAITWQTELVLGLQLKRFVPWRDRRLSASVA